MWLLYDFLSDIYFFFVVESLEISGPPQFLNNSVEEANRDALGQKGRPGGRRIRKDRKDLPPGKHCL